MGSVIQYAFILTLGSEARFHGMGRAGGPVIMYIITYLLQQLVSMVGLLLIPFGLRFTLAADGEMVTAIDLVAESSWPSLRDTLMGIEKQSFTLGLGFILLLLALYIVYMVMTIKSLEHHTSLR